MASEPRLRERVDRVTVLATIYYLTFAPSMFTSKALAVWNSHEPDEPDERPVTG
jgi:hypothetical protein